MIGAVHQGGLESYHRISCQRALLHALLDSLLNRREVVLRNRAAEHSLLEDVGSLQIAGGLELHLDVAVLAVSAGLLLVLALDLHFLLEGLAERKFRLA